MHQPLPWLPIPIEDFAGKVTLPQEIVPLIVFVHKVVPLFATPPLTVVVALPLALPADIAYVQAIGRTTVISADELRRPNGKEVVHGLVEEEQERMMRWELPLPLLRHWVAL